jgi:hypothetical protein
MHKVRHKKLSVQVPVERVINSIGLGPKSPHNPSKINRASGAKQRKNKTGFNIRSDTKIV